MKEQKNQNAGMEEPIELDGSRSKNKGSRHREQEEEGGLRVHGLRVRFNDEELAVVQKKAKLAKKPLAPYLREVGLGIKQISVADSVQWQKLGGFGSELLEQKRKLMKLLQEVNETKNIEAEFTTLLAKNTEILEQTVLELQSLREKLL
ncbi:plasmid mobilization protein [Candidatus Cyanaurora vandensis]|uniref:plasmid mobilization protein n=1 Tax=Candidatus Cyanaurora vandensis TaxID=2714958 RepID=UPI00257BCEE2|nr:hypothetical protein [Candidatus Cyanaurora vandensis]